MLSRLAFLALLLLSPQDEFATLLRQLSDDRPAVRDGSLEKLIQGCEAWRPRLEEALAKSTDLEVQGRLRHVLAEGRRRAQKARCLRALPDRIHRDFPTFADALFSRDPDRCLEAVAALGQTYEAGKEGSAFPNLFITPAEARRAVPEMMEVLDSSPEFAKVRLAWANVLITREEMLDDPVWEGWARTLLQDPDPAVRAQGAQLARKVARPEDVLDQVAKWDSLDTSTRWYLVQAIVLRRIEAAYPFLIARMEGYDHGEMVVRMILQYRVGALLPGAIQYLRKNFEHMGSIDLVEDLGSEEATDLLLKRLNAHPEAAVDVIRMLGRKGTRESSDVVAGYLASSDWKTRLAAIEALGSLGATGHAEAIAGVLRDYIRKNDSSLPYPSSVITLLDRWNAADELGSLIEVLPGIQDFDGHFITAIGRLRPPKAAEKLAPYLDQGNEIGRRALVLMSMIGAQSEARAHLPSIKRLFDDQAIGYGTPGAAQAVAKLGLRELIPIFVAHIRHPSFRPMGPVLCQLWTPAERRAALKSAQPAVREAGIVACVASDELADAEDALAAGVADANRDVRWTAAVSPQRYLSDRANELLAKLTSDPDAEVAGTAAESLFRYGGNAFYAEKNLLSLLRSPSAVIRLRALDRVSSEMVSKDSEVIELLRKDPNEEVRKKFLSSIVILDEVGVREIGERLSKERGVFSIFRILFSLEKISPVERVAPLVRVFLERILAENPTTIETESSASLHGDAAIGLERVADQAGRLAAMTGRPELIPVLLELIASDRPELQKGGAAGLGPLKCPEAVPRLVQLLPSESGDAAALALGRLNAIPPEIFSHPSEVVRMRAFKAAQISRDHGLFEAALGAVGNLSRDNTRAAMEILGELARPEDAPRLLELTQLPKAELRGAAIGQASRFLRPELSETVAGFLDDNYMVHLQAAEYILGSGDSRFAAKAARRMLKHFPDRAARIVRRFGLREEAPLLLPGLDVPGNPAMGRTAVEVAEAYASLGMKEYLPAAVAKMKILGGQERLAMIKAVARLGGPEAIPAIREELHSSERATRLFSSEVLADLGDRKFGEDLRRDILDDLHNPSAARLLVKLGWRDVCEEAIAKAEKQRVFAESLWSAAARLGMPGAREKITEALRANPERLIRVLQSTWGLSDEALGWDGYDYYHRKVRNLIEKLERSSGRKVVLRGQVPEGFLDSVILAGSMGSLLSALPGKWSAFIDDHEQIVIDRLEVIQSAWLDRLQQ
jgi:HEAT repeat protein